MRYYLPGYKSGGPVRTITNMVDHLGDDFNFYIITSDRDVLDDAPYPDVAIDAWNQVGKAQVYYASQANCLRCARLIIGMPHDALYFNSFFDPVFTLQPLLARWLKWLPKRPIVIAPRGEFSPGALALKCRRKRLYCAVAGGIGLYKDLVWQASSNYEIEDIRRVMKDAARRISVAPDLPPVLGGDKRENNENPSPREGPLRVVFLSRITPMKNLDFALCVLAKVRNPVQFNIYGPIGETAYWRQCQALIARLPSNVTVHYGGGVKHGEVPAVMAAHDLFFLPTLGENYGHVISESLSAGTPVLIADTTPWRGLKEAGVGWDLPLDKEQSFVDCIHYMAELKPEDRVELRRKAASYAEARLHNPEVVISNRQLFIEAISGGQL